MDVGWGVRHVRQGDTVHLHRLCILGERRMTQEANESPGKSEIKKKGIYT